MILFETILFEISSWLELSVMLSVCLSDYLSLGLFVC